MPECPKLPNLYGPVPSRRLGLSLGIDVVPYKTCSYDCVYCQLGRTMRLISKPEPLMAADEVTHQLKQWFGDGNTADYLTFAGSGEPTLNAELGEMIRRAASLSSIPVAVLTNGSLLWKDEVMKAVSKADVLLPSLDAGTEEVFQRINRPCADLDFRAVVDGLLQTRRHFRGEVWLEVMLVRGLNDSPAELAAMKGLIDRIRPDRVQINSVERPSGSGRAVSVSPKTLDEAFRVFGPGSEIIVSRLPATRTGSRDETESAVVALVSRRPCRLQDIVAATGLHVNEVVKLVQELMSIGAIEPSGKPSDPHYRGVNLGRRS